MGTLTGDVDQVAQMAAKAAFDAEMKIQKAKGAAYLPKFAFVVAQKAGKSAYDLHMKTMADLLN